MNTNRSLGRVKEDTCCPIAYTPKEVLYLYMAICDPEAEGWVPIMHRGKPMIDAGICSRKQPQ